MVSVWSHVLTKGDIERHHFPTSIWKFASILPQWNGRATYETSMQTNQLSGPIPVERFASTVDGHHSAIRVVELSNSLGPTALLVWRDGKESILVYPQFPHRNHAVVFVSDPLQCKVQWLSCNKVKII